MIDTPHEVFAVLGHVVYADGTIDREDAFTILGLYPVDMRIWNTVEEPVTTWQTAG